MNKVLIIGAGIIGLSIARELKKRGVSEITILEKGETGKESSYAAGGMLAPHAETDEFNEFFAFCRESLELYPQLAEELLAETGTDVELSREGTLYLAFSEHDLAEIKKRYEWQKSSGLQVKFLSPTEIHKLEPFVSPDVLGGLFFPNDWQIENRKLLSALETFCRLNKINIKENIEITRIVSEKGKVKGASGKDQTFFADTVILATGAWTSLIQTESFKLPKIKPIKGQMIVFQTAKRLFGKVIYSPRGYLIPRQDGRIVVGSTTEDTGFDKSVTDLGLDIVREKALEIAPSLINLEVSDSWAGLRPFAPDGLPILGELAENLLVAAAHYRNGILLAPATAKIIADKVIEGKDSIYFRAFSPNRLPSLNAGQ